MYDKEKLIEYARQLRQKQTDCEKILWYLLRNKQISGTKFRRQVPFANYILDFYCFDKKIAIECDGSQHYSLDGQEKDRQRDIFLKKHDIKILRFSNLDILQNIDGVLELIFHTIENS